MIGASKSISAREREVARHRWKPIEDSVEDYVSIVARDPGESFIPTLEWCVDNAESDWWWEYDWANWMSDSGGGEVVPIVFYFKSESDAVAFSLARL